MTRKTAWLYEQDRSKGVGLTIRVEHEESAPDLTVSIKLSREEEEKSFQITKELMQRIEESAALLKEVPFPRRPAEDGPIIQHRFEDQESGLVLMWEIPPFKRHDDIKHRI